MLNLAAAPQQCIYSLFTKQKMNSRKNEQQGGRGWVGRAIGRSVWMWVYTRAHVCVFSHAYAAAMSVLYFHMWECLCCEMIQDQVSVSAVKCALEGGSERNGVIFSLASMQWDSTLQGLAASQTPLLPRKRAAAWHPRGATQFNCFWPFSVAGAKLSVSHITKLKRSTAQNSTRP